MADQPVQAAEVCPRFHSAAARERFVAAYETAVARWPAGTVTRDVGTPVGSAHVLSCGPDEAAPLVLLPGGGMTAAGWAAPAARMAPHHRVHAIDLPGDVGLGRTDTRRLKQPADLAAWLTAVLDGLGLSDPVALCGHSYGAWLALNQALRTPGRISHLVLLDPTQCFGGFAPAYLAHALPLLLRPTAARVRALLAWETRGDQDETATGLAAVGADEAATRIVRPRRPRSADLRRCNVPTLVLLAARSRAHRVDRIAARAQRLMPTATVATLPGASHHSAPYHDPEALAARIAAFLGR